MTTSVPILPDTGASRAGGPSAAGVPATFRLADGSAPLQATPRGSERPAGARSRTRWSLLPGDVTAGLLAALSTIGFGAPATGLTLTTGLMPLLWVLLLLWDQGYERHPAPVPMDEVARVARSGVSLVAASVVLATLVHEDLPSRSLLLVAAIATTLSLGSRLVLLRGAFGSSRRRTGTVRVVVAGHRRDAARLVAELRAGRDRRFEVAAVCLPRAAAGPDLDVPVAVGFDALTEAVRRHRAEAVIAVPGRHLGPAVLRRLGWLLETTGTHLFVSSGLTDVATTRATVGNGGATGLVHVRHATLRGARRVTKDAGERLVAALLLPLLAPLLLVLALAIRLESDGPALFRQTRIGRDGTPFTMLKLRTMTTDAELRRIDLVSRNNADGVLFKLREDPRVTRVGRFLRRYSLDELPQLVNVLRGDMALVGPRPALADEVAGYDFDTHRRLAVKPGITGLWQVSGRSDLSWEETVRLDLRYVDNWSLGLDLLILCRTARAVLGHDGAY